MKKFKMYQFPIKSVSLNYNKNIYVVNDVYLFMTKNIKAKNIHNQFNIYIIKK